MDNDGFTGDTEITTPCCPHCGQLMYQEHDLKVENAELVAQLKAEKWHHARLREKLEPILCQLSEASVHKREAEQKISDLEHELEIVPRALIGISLGAALLLLTLGFLEKME